MGNHFRPSGRLMRKYLRCSACALASIARHRSATAARNTQSPVEGRDQCFDLLRTTFPSPNRPPPCRMKSLRFFIALPLLGVLLVVAAEQTAPMTKLTSNL